MAGAVVEVALGSLATTHGPVLNILARCCRTPAPAVGCAVCGPSRSPARLYRQRGHLSGDHARWSPAEARGNHRSCWCVAAASTGDAPPRRRAGPHPGLHRGRLVAGLTDNMAI